MKGIYSEQHRRLQRQFETERLADKIDEIGVLSEIPEEHKSFIETRDMFFLTTVDHRGYPTCSYKGGRTGFVRVIDSTTIAFPSYNGNGMFLSMGNINENSKIGMLFIDFETPHRIRCHGVATIDEQDALMNAFEGAERVIRVALTEIFVNCPRYIHSYKRQHTSKYVPHSEDEILPIPQWKRLESLHDSLPELDKRAVSELGTISRDEYRRLIAKGEA